jgi:hypothetical protein
MTKKRKAELCDAVILKFEDDKSFFWNDLHGHKKSFNDLILDSDCDKGTDPDSKYYVVQPIINLLLEDGILKRMDEQTPRPYLSLTDKGNAIYPDIKHRGYATKYKKERNKSIWVVISGIIIIATFLLLIYNTFFNHKQIKVMPQKSDTATPQSSTRHEAILEPTKQSDTSDLSHGTDTTSKSRLLPTKDIKSDKKNK